MPLAARPAWAVAAGWLSAGWARLRGGSRASPPPARSSAARLLRRPRGRSASAVAVAGALAGSGVGTRALAATALCGTKRRARTCVSVSRAASRTYKRGASFALARAASATFQAARFDVSEKLPNTRAHARAHTHTHSVRRPTQCAAEHTQCARRTQLTTVARAPRTSDRSAPSRVIRGR